MNTLELAIRNTALERENAALRAWIEQLRAVMLAMPDVPEPASEPAHTGPDYASQWRYTPAPARWGKQP